MDGGARGLFVILWRGFCRPFRRPAVRRVRYIFRRRARFGRTPLGLPPCDGGMYNPIEVHVCPFFSPQIYGIKTLPSNYPRQNSINHFIYCFLTMSCAGALRQHGESPREPSVGKEFTANACETACMNPANPFS